MTINIQILWIDGNVVMVMRQNFETINKLELSISIVPCFCKWKWQPVKSLNLSFSFDSFSTFSCYTPTYYVDVRWIHGRIHFLVTYGPIQIVRMHFQVFFESPLPLYMLSHAFWYPLPPKCTRFMLQTFLHFCCQMFEKVSWWLVSASVQDFKTLKPKHTGFVSIKSDLMNTQVREEYNPHSP